MGEINKVLEGRVRGLKKESPTSPFEELIRTDMSDLSGKSEKPGLSS